MIFVDRNKKNPFDTSKDWNKFCYIKKKFEPVNRLVGEIIWWKKITLEQASLTSIHFFNNSQKFYANAALSLGKKTGN